MNSATIQEIWGRCKVFLDKRVGEWGIPILILFVGLSCFGLGRLSASESARPAVSITHADTASEMPKIGPGGLIVASRTGSAYHFPWCAGAETIKEGNKVWFEDEEAARRAGYAPAKNCKGLK